MPNIDSNELYHMEPDKQSELLLTHLEMNLLVLHNLRDRFNEIRNLATNLAIPWARQMESDMAHLEIDLSYLESNIRHAREK